MIAASCLQASQVASTDLTPCSRHKALLGKHSCYVSMGCLRRVKEIQHTVVGNSGEQAEN